MRLALAIPALDRGGATAFLVYLAQAISQRTAWQVDVFACTHSANPYISQASARLVPPETLPGHLARGGYDLVHWFRTSDASYFLRALAASRRGRIRMAPQLITVCQLPMGRDLALTPEELAVADRFIFIARAAKAHPIYRWIHERDSALIYFGTYASPGLAGDPSNRTSTVVIGRGSQVVKCPPDMVSLFEQIDLPRAQFDLVLWGDGAARERVLRALDSSTVQGRFTCRDHLSPEEWQRYLRRLDIFLYHLPGDAYSAIDGALQDAMLAGLPVVLLGPEAPGELIVHGTSGFVCQSKDEAARCVRRLAQEPALRRRVGLAARERILRDFSFEDTVERYLRVYRDLQLGPQMARAKRWVPLSYRLWFLAQSPLVLRMTRSWHYRTGLLRRVLLGGRSRPGPRIRS